MALVPARCPNCGGMIQIESDNKAGICAFCKQAFVSEDAITNYNTYNSTYNQNTYNIENADLHIVDDSSIDKKLESAETFLTKLNDYTESHRLFEEVSKSAPERYEAWLGLAKVKTSDFDIDTPIDNETDYRTNPANYDGIADNIKRAIKVASAEKQLEIRTAFRKYLNGSRTQIEHYRDKLGEERRSLGIRKQDVYDQLRDLENERDRLTNKNYKRDKTAKSLYDPLLVLGAFLSGGGGLAGLIWILLGGSPAFLMISLIAGAAVFILIKLIDKGNDNSSDTIGQQLEQIRAKMQEVSGDPYWSSEGNDKQYAKDIEKIDNRIQNCDSCIEKINGIMKETM